MSDEKVNSFVFYRGFAEAAEKMSPLHREKYLRALYKYALDGEEIKLSGQSDMAFGLSKPVIDSNINRRKAAKKGGAPKGNQNAKKQPEEEIGNNQCLNKKITDGCFKKQPNENENINGNINENENVKEKETEKEIKKAEANAVFEKLWKLYPSKAGKGQVSDAKKRKIAEIGFEEMSRAIARYKRGLERDKDWRKPQNGSTFFNSGYVDYLDENYVEGDVDGINKWGDLGGVKA